MQEQEMSDIDIQTHMNGTSKGDCDSECKKEKVDQADEAEAPLTPRQVQLILDTWEPVKPNLQEHGIVLFLE